MWQPGLLNPQQGGGLGELPEPIYVGLTIYLLLAIGFKGGVAIAEAGLAKVWLPVLAAMGRGLVVPPAVASALLTRLQRDYFPLYGMVAFESDVRVLRPNKF